MEDFFVSGQYLINFRRISIMRFLTDQFDFKKATRRKTKEVGDLCLLGIFIILHILFVPFDEIGIIFLEHGAIPPSVPK